MLANLFSLWICWLAFTYSKLFIFLIMHIGWTIAQQLRNGNAKENTKPHFTRKWNISMILPTPVPHVGTFNRIENGFYGVLRGQVNMAKARTIGIQNGKNGPDSNGNNNSNKATRNINDNSRDNKRLAPELNMFGTSIQMIRK